MEELRDMLIKYSRSKQPSPYKEYIEDAEKAIQYNREKAQRGRKRRAVETQKAIDSISNRVDALRTNKTKEELRRSAFLAKYCPAEKKTYMTLRNRIVYFSWSMNEVNELRERGEAF